MVKKSLTFELWLRVTNYLFLVNSIAFKYLSGYFVTIATKILLSNSKQDFER